MLSLSFIYEPQLSLLIMISLLATTTPSFPSSEDRANRSF